MEGGGVGGRDDSRGIKGSDWRTANRGLRDGVVGRGGVRPGCMAVSQAAVSPESNCIGIVDWVMEDRFLGILLKGLHVYKRLVNAVIITSGIGGVQRQIFGS